MIFIKRKFRIELWTHFGSICPKIGAGSATIWDEKLKNQKVIVSSKFNSDSMRKEVMKKLFYLLVEVQILLD